MLDSSKPFTFDRVVRISIAVIVIVALLLIIGVLKSVLIPFAVALLIAYLLNPIVDFFERKVKIRGIAVFITLLLFFAILGLIGWLIVPLIIQEVNHMIKLLSSLISNSSIAIKAEQRLPESIWNQIQSYMQRDDIQEMFKSNDIQTLATSVSQKVIPELWRFVTGTASFVFGLLGFFIILLYIFFILKDYNKIKKWQEMIPLKYRKDTIDFINEFKFIMNRYFRGQSLIASIVGIFFATGFWIIGLPMGILVGLLMGLLNMVPYLQILGIIPITFVAGMYALETATSFWSIFGLALLVVAITQTIQDTILIPKIMGKVTGFNPAFILLFLSIWGSLLGLLGMIIALPFSYLILTYYKRYLDKHAENANL